MSAVLYIYVAQFHENTQSLAHFGLRHAHALVPSMPRLRSASRQCFGSQTLWSAARQRFVLQNANTFAWQRFGPLHAIALFFSMPTPLHGKLWSAARHRFVLQNANTFAWQHFGPLHAIALFFSRPTHLHVNALVRRMPTLLSVVLHSLICC